MWTKTMEDRSRSDEELRQMAADIAEANRKADLAEEDDAPHSPYADLNKLPVLPLEERNRKLREAGAAHIARYGEPDTSDLQEDLQIMESQLKAFEAESRLRQEEKDRAQALNNNLAPKTTLPPQPGDLLRHLWKSRKSK